MTKPKQTARDKPRKPAYPRKMFAAEKGLWTGFSSLLLNADEGFGCDHPVLVFDLSPASVEALRQKVAQVFISERDTWTTCDTPEVPAELIDGIFRALGFPPAKRKGVES